MLGRRGERWDAPIAWAAVLVLHALVAVQLARLRRPALPVMDTALQVVWIKRAPPSQGAAAAPPLPRRERTAASALQAHAIAAARPSPRPPNAAAAAMDATPGPTSAEILASTDAWLRARVPAEVPAADPLADRPVALTPPPPERFRMRKPVSPADLVATVGRMLGGGGEDDCARYRAEIAAYGIGGGDRRLDQAIDHERRHCRP